jgi:propionyl-CoA synthetase
MTAYTSLYAGWQANPDSYWAECANLIDWDKAPEQIFDGATGPYGTWFPDAKLNTSYNCLDRHIAAGHGDRIAFIWDSPMEGKLLKITYAEARDRVARIAGALRKLGVQKGDRVVIYMPMVPEAAFSMLACARLGAIHSMVFGGFAPPELAARISDAKPKAIIAASCGLEPGRLIAYKPMLDAALELSDHKPDACLIFQRPACQAQMTPGLDHDFIAAEEAAEPAGPVSVEATHPLYILYTSGTTGRPKGVVRDNGGHAVALAQSMKTTYGVGAGEVMWAAADVGWAVGHSYVVYGPMLVGATSIIYEGKPVGTPDAGAFWRVIEQHKVKTMFTAPTALRAIKQQDFAGEYLRKYDLSNLQALFLAGERCDPPTAIWIQKLLDKPVIDNWWQTETGWPITSRFLGLGLTPFKPGSGGRPSPGYDVQALDEAGEPVGRGTVGNLCIHLPMPPGCGPTLWQNDDGYVSAYLKAFPGWYRTGDAGMIDEDGDVWIMGRTDDIINVAGHRLSTGAMEEVVAGHKDIAECAVIARSDDVKGEIPCGLVVLKAGVERDPKQVEAELIALVREKIGPVAAFREVMVVPRLPKTRSGKILRAAMKKIANGEPVTVPGTIEDASVLDQIREAFAAVG